jgi:hypothetical protein
MLLYIPPDANDGYEETIHTCEDSTCSATLDHGILHCFKSRHSLMVITRIALLVVQDCEDPVQATRQYFTTNRIKLALTQLDFPVCSHLRTSSPFLYNHYTAACTEHQAIEDAVWSYTCSFWKGVSRKPCIEDDYECCPECLKYPSGFTLFGFRTFYFKEGGVKKLLLALDLHRDLGYLDSCTDPGWTSHTSYSVRTKFLSQEWQRWMKYRRETITGWETRPATPIFEDITIENPRAEDHSLRSKCMSLFRKDFRAKGFTWARREGSKTPAREPR